MARTPKKAEAEVEVETEAPSEPLTAPERMRRAREAAGLSLQDVATRTRVPVRHLAALEEGDYKALPGTTYCAGFSRAFARAVGLDEAELVAQVRSEIDEMGGVSSDPYEFEEAVDPSSVPPRLLAWTVAILAILLAGGYAIWRMQLNTPPTDEQLQAERETETRIADPNGAAQPVARPTPPATGPVVMTAVNEVWLRIYEPDGTKLFEGTLARNQSFTLPATAQNPMILTGRPDALSVTVGGQAVPPLGTAERTVSDLPVSAAALLARASGDEAAAPAPASNGAANGAAAP